MKGQETVGIKCHKCGWTAHPRKRDVDKVSEAHAWGPGTCGATPADIRKGD